MWSMAAGEPLQPAAWMDDPRVRLVTTFQTERVVARNTGAALSRGQWLYFLDDDDYSLPGGFAALLARAAVKPGCGCVYGSYIVADGAAGVETAVRPGVEGDFFPVTFAGESVPLQASWIRRESFLAVGGFDTRLVLAEDADFIHRLAQKTTFAWATPLVSAIGVNHERMDEAPSRAAAHAGSQKWATDYRRFRAKQLTLPGTLSRLWGVPSSYWAGRCVRRYLSEAWNRKEALPLAQGCFGAAAIACRHALVPDFWQGLRLKRRVSQSFEHGQR